MLIDYLSKSHKVREHNGVHVIDEKRAVVIRKKTKPTLHRQTGRMEFGIPLRDWNRFSRWQMPLYIAVECEGKTYFAPLTTLDAAKRTWVGDNVDRGGTVFLPLEAFTRLKT